LKYERFIYAQSVAPVLACNFPESGEGQNLGKFARMEIPARVAFAAKGEHGVRTSFYAAADHAREVNTEEGKIQVR
jgi:hypothetical protein